MNLQPATDKLYLTCSECILAALQKKFDLSRFDKLAQINSQLKEANNALAKLHSDLDDLCVGEGDGPITSRLSEITNLVNEIDAINARLDSLYDAQVDFYKETEDFAKEIQPTIDELMRTSTGLVVGPWSKQENTVRFSGTCTSNHQNEIEVGNHPYEIFFEFGLIRLINGEYRESVFNLQAALEEFLRFYVQVHLEEKRIPSDRIDEFWRYARKSSERQKGLFLALYFLDLTGRGAEPAFLASDLDKLTRLRNEVIHGGHFPTQGESLEFLDKTYSLICSIVDILGAPKYTNSPTYAQHGLEWILAAFGRRDLLDKIESRSFPWKDAEYLDTFMRPERLNSPNREGGFQEWKAYLIRDRKRYLPGGTIYRYLRSTD